jgi:hypothetical protein
MTTEEHQYIKNKIRLLRAEYKGTDAKKILDEAGHKCAICGRKDGEVYLFGPTLYLKKQLQFKVKIHIHVIRCEKKSIPVVFCDGCHLSYHLFNRLGPGAKFGRKALNKTVFRVK